MIITNISGNFVAHFENGEKEALSSIEIDQNKKDLFINFFETQLAIASSENLSSEVDLDKKITHLTKLQEMQGAVVAGNSQKITTVWEQFSTNLKVLSQKTESFIDKANLKKVFIDDLYHQFTCNENQLESLLKEGEDSFSKNELLQLVKIASGRLTNKEAEEVDASVYQLSEEWKAISEFLHADIQEARQANLSDPRIGDISRSKDRFLCFLNEFEWGVGADVISNNSFTLEDEEEEERVGFEGFDETVIDESEKVAEIAADSTVCPVDLEEEKGSDFEGLVKVVIAGSGESRKKILDLTPEALEILNGLNSTEFLRLDVSLLRMFSDQAIKGLNAQLINNIFDDDILFLDAHLFNNLSDETFKELNSRVLKCIFSSYGKELKDEKLNLVFERIDTIKSAKVINRFYKNISETLLIDILNKLPKEEIGELEATVFNYLSLEIIRDLKIDVLNNLSIFTMFNLKKGILNVLPKDALHQLEANVINNLHCRALENLRFVLRYLSEQTLRGLKARSINNFSADELKDLTASMLNNLPIEEIKELEPHVLNSLSPDEIEKLEYQVLNNFSIGIYADSTDMFVNIATERSSRFFLSYFKIDYEVLKWPDDEEQQVRINGTEEEKEAAWARHAVGFRADIFNKLSVKVIQNLTPQRFNTLTKETIKGLEPHVINHLSAGTIRGLSANVLNKLSDQTIRGLKPRTIAQLENLKGLKARFLNNLSDQVLLDLPAELLNNLSDEAFEGLDARVLDSFREDHLQYLEARVLKKVMAVKLRPEPRGLTS